MLVPTKIAKSRKELLDYRRMMKQIIGLRIGPNMIMTNNEKKEN